MTDWGRKIPLVTLLAVVAAAGGLWVRVDRLVADVDRVAQRLDRLAEGVNADRIADLTERRAAR